MSDLRPGVELDLLPADWHDVGGGDHALASVPVARHHPVGVVGGAHDGELFILGEGQVLGGRAREGIQRHHLRPRGPRTLPTTQTIDFFAPVTQHHIHH